VDRPELGGKTVAVPVESRDDVQPLQEQRTPIRNIKTERALKAGDTLVESVLSLRLSCRLLPSTQLPLIFRSNSYVAMTLTGSRLDVVRYLCVRWSSATMNGVRPISSFWSRRAP
jgi:hypothetical protein